MSPRVIPKPTFGSQFLQERVGSDDFSGPKGDQLFHA